MSAPTANTAPEKYLVAYFLDDDNILAATQATRSAGLPIHDCYTPFPVHGLEAAQGLPRSFLTYVALVLAALGFCTSMFMQSYTQAAVTPLWSGWPLIVGGKPFLPITAFVPVLFELTVLFCGVGTAIALFVTLRLFPGKKVEFVLPGVTDDRFALVLDPSGSGFDEAKARALCGQHGASEITWVLAQ